MTIFCLQISDKNFVGNFYFSETVHVHHKSHSPKFY